MSTKAIQLPEDLHRRISLAAEHAGVTPHALVLQAIEELLIRQAEDAEDDLREKKLFNAGLSIPMAEVHSYFASRARGVDARRPTPKKFKS
jgi:predicted transcriptional regulator